MKIQIYTAQSPSEALALAGRGVDHVGISPSLHQLPGAVDYEMGGRIAAALRGSAVSVALTVDTEPDEIVRMAAAVKPDILHLCGPAEGYTPESVEALKKRLEGLPLMQAIGMGGPDCIEKARAFSRVADYLILDTEADFMDAVGASGAVHDWSLSRRIVDEVDIPVILAGGLSPANVAEAIRAVRPWGVDSLTHTNAPLADGGFRKDLDKVSAFVQAAGSVL